MNAADGGLMGMEQTRSRARAWLAGSACALAVAAVAPAAQAAQFNVNTTGDPAPGPCEPAPGNCSLREAVLAANFSDGPDEVNLPAGTYTLVIPGTGSGGDLNVNEPLTIRNTGAP